jgi:hypothetical protein
MNAEFNEWWNEDLLTEDNPFVENTAAYWAWEGWCAAVKVERKANIGCIGRIAAMVVDPIDQARLYEAMDAIRARSNT